jgi:hypothetical protein
MGPAVIADLVALAHGPGDDLGMRGDVFTDDKESGLDVVSGQKIEKFRRKFRAWAVVESEGYFGSIDAYPAEGDRRGHLYERFVFLRPGSWS